jgi:predicted nucleic acid-binding protein
MKILVTDACIFIDVIELQLTSKFFNLNVEIHTTADVLSELYDSQQQILEGYRASSKLTVHVLTGEEQMELLNTPFPKALTPEDQSVLFIAKKLKNAAVLSSDKPVRKCAKNLSIEYHGMLWILDKLVDENLLSKPEASAKINALVNSNIIYKNNNELLAEINLRLKLWSK